MSKFTVQITTDNAAFHDDDNDEAAGDELARILSRVISLIDDGIVAGTLKDSNGNTVGSFEWELDE